MPLAVGDRITVITVALAVHVRAVHTLVIYVDTKGFTCRAASDVRDMHRWWWLDPLAVEGVGWCHGWKMEDGHALLAAHALS